MKLVKMSLLMLLAANVAWAQPSTASEDLAIGRAGNSISYLQYKDQRYLIDGWDYTDKIAAELKRTGAHYLTLTLENMNTHQVETFAYTPYVPNGSGGFYTQYISGSTSQYFEWAPTVGAQTHLDLDYFGKYKSVGDYALDLKIGGEMSMRERTKGWIEGELRGLEKEFGRELTDDEAKVVIDQMRSNIMELATEPKRFRHVVMTLFKKIQARGGKLHVNLDSENETLLKELAGLSKGKRKLRVHLIYNKLLNGRISDKKMSSEEQRQLVDDLEILTIFKDRSFLKSAVVYKNFETAPLTESEVERLYVGE